MSVAAFERRFLDGEGRLRTWPSKLTDQKAALAWLCDQMTPGERLSERDFNEWLKARHTFDDWAILRRSLVDHGFVQREGDGSAYWRVPARDSRAS